MFNSFLLFLPILLLVLPLISSSFFFLSFCCLSSVKFPSTASSQQLAHTAWTQLPLSHAFTLSPCYSLSRQYVSVCLVQGRPTFPAILSWVWSEWQLAEFVWSSSYSHPLFYLAVFYPCPSSVSLTSLWPFTVESSKWCHLITPKWKYTNCHTIKG